MNSCTCYLLALIIFLGLPQLVKADEPPAETGTSTITELDSDEGASDAEEEITSGTAFLLKLKQGGQTIFFLLLCSIVVVACVMERFVNQRKSRIAPDGLSEQARKLWAAQDWAGLQALINKNDSTLSRMLSAIAQYRHISFEKVSIIASDIASRDLKRHLQRAYPLAIVATIAPLLGLFGTVLGMIGAFDKIAVLGELTNPAAFGGDIGKALITTGVGLAIAIASLTFYHWFKSRIAVYGVELEEQVSSLLLEWFEAPPKTEEAKSIDTEKESDNAD